ncbi:MAG: HAD hydrolase-like protein, partial [Clostridia bacterium]|nr:HAD hydrolase-like protein [Clostridia bacterium]
MTQLTPNYDTVIFDLDGTLLYTLTDLTTAVNAAMHRFGWQERTLEEMRHFVGNG